MFSEMEMLAVNPMFERLFIALVSLGLGFWLMLPGDIGHVRMHAFIAKYDERYGTAIGKSARSPLLVDYLRQQWLHLLLLFFLLGLNIWFFQQYSLVREFELWTAIFISEAAAILLIQRYRSRRFEDDMEDYLFLTSPGNRFFDGTVSEIRDGSRGTGEYCVLIRQGEGSTLSLFVSPTVDQSYPLQGALGCSMRVFYRVRLGESSGIAGDLVGFQPLSEEGSDPNRRLLMIA